MEIRLRRWAQARGAPILAEYLGGAVTCDAYLITDAHDWAQARGAPILAEYLGGAVTCDAYHMTDPRADGLGVSTCIELALKNAGIERDEVWMECTCLAA